jgi:hypothetical protein
MYVMTFQFPCEPGYVVATSDSIPKLIEHAKERNKEESGTYDIDVKVKDREEYIQVGDEESYDTYEIYQVKHV